MQKMELLTPLTDAAVRQLRAGDEVLISGPVLTARDQAHKRLCDAVAAGQPLPVDLTDAVVYFVGPTPAAPGRVIGAAGPTTSSRMDAFTPTLLANGLKATIGKGYRSQAVRDAFVRYGGVHFAALGGGGALLSNHIVESGIVAYEDLGAEAIRRLEFREFPVVVAYDCYGGSVYKTEKTGNRQ
jgi:fumarate hydratase subunit beta